MSDVPSHPSHVPAELVRSYGLEFEGSIDDLFGRLDAMRAEAPALWLQAGVGAVFGGTGAGTWFLTRSEDVRFALQHPELFSSAQDLNDLAGEGGSAAGSVSRMIPILLDPPEHTKFRRLLNPLFSPPVIAQMQEGIKGRIERLVDELAPKGSCDFVNDIAIQFPTRVFTSWVGLPEEETHRFVAMVKSMHGPPEGRAMATMSVLQLLSEFVRDRLENPKDDLMSAIVRGKVDDRDLTFEELMSIALLLFIAGLDTVATALSFSFWHLARHPEQRAAVASGSVPSSVVVEEMLRRHTFVVPPRRVTQDIEFAGVQMKRNDPVMVGLPTASRDPEDHDRPEDVDFERGGNRHYAFGVGVHRCIGSHLARLEMELAFDVWHARIPDYRLDADPVAHGGALMGMSTLPLSWS